MKKAAILLIGLMLIQTTVFAQSLEVRRNGEELLISGKLDTASCVISLLALPSGQPASKEHLQLAAQQASDDGSYCFRLIPLTPQQKYQIIVTDGTSERRLERDFIYDSMETLRQVVAEVNQAKTPQELIETLGRNVSGRNYAEILGVNLSALNEFSLEERDGILAMVLSRQPFSAENSIAAAEAFKEGIALCRLSGETDLARFCTLFEELAVQFNVRENKDIDYLFSEVVKPVKQNGVFVRMMDAAFQTSVELRAAYESAVVLTAIEDPVKGLYDMSVIFEKGSHVLGITKELPDYLSASASERGKVDRVLFQKVYATPEMAGAAFREGVANVDRGTENPVRPPGGSNGGGSGGGLQNQTFPNKPAGQPAQPAQPAQLEPPQRTDFVDLGTVSWAAEAIGVLYERGIIQGKEPQVFAPLDFVTREEFLKLLVYSLGLADDTAVSDFTDVERGGWYYTAVASGQQSGIANGIGDGFFGVGQTITRQDMCVMACRGIAAAGKKLLAAEPDFADTESIPDYAKASVGAMKSAGLVNGLGDNLFGGMQNANRAEAAKLVFEILQYIEGDAA